MKEVNFYDFKFNINPRNYYDADKVIANPLGTFECVQNAIGITSLNIGASTIWGPIIAKYFGVSEVPGVQDYITGAIFVAGQSLILGVSSNDVVENSLCSLHDSCRLTGDFAVAAIGQAYNSYFESGIAE